MSKISDFVLKLYEKTNDSSVRWEETTQDNIYQLSFKNYSVQIIGWFDDMGENNGYAIRILNNEGYTIDQIDSEQLSSEIQNPNFIFAIMYSKAKRIATGADKAIDIIMKELTKEEAPF